MDNIDIIALGGNAILPHGKPGTIHQQFAITRVTLAQIAQLVADGRRIVITHGNGPIVGNIMLRNEAASAEVPPMPLGICVADSQGGIGYMLQQVMTNALAVRGIKREVVTVVTQVVIDGDDPALGDPQKPIGPYYKNAEATRRIRINGWKMVEVAGRGYRRVVPSPRPVEIVEQKTIEKLVTTGVLVIAVGGGGIPVIREHDLLSGVEAVVDKDRASSVLARALNAERMIIVTDVDAVYKDYGTDSAAPIKEMSARAAKRLGVELPDGSMGPKLEAAAEFVEATGGTAIITSPEQVLDAVAGESGTRITGVHDENSVTLR